MKLSFCLEKHLRLAWLLAIPLLGAAEGPPTAPTLTDLTFTTNGQKRITWSPYPAADAYRMRTTTRLGTPDGEDLTGTITGFEWTAPLQGPVGFHRLEVTPVSSNALLTALLLNRLAYGPTLDEWERILTGPEAIGPQAYLEEQLAPEHIVDDIDTPPDGPDWTYRTATGPINGNNFIIYLSGAGQVRLDDMMLVEGTIPETGVNLLENGGFEVPTLEPWIATSNYAGSYIDASLAHSGNSSLVLVGEARGSTSANAFYQGITNRVSNGQVYTLSYWYLPEENNASRDLTVRLSGNLASSVHSIQPFPVPGRIYPQLLNRTARLADLRAWFLMHAVASKSQLLEVLLQFLENHFVTQHAKTYEYYDRYYDGAEPRDQIATYLEFRELSRWRQALLNPSCTFLDLLRISAESPAMIIYLDTVNSRGNGNNIANENYARELLELFTLGVDNGYDQEDIVEVSRTWTGWTVEIVDEANLNDPLAPRSTTLIDTNNINVRSNLLGVWTFHYNSSRHDTNAKTIFPGRTIPARFGAPWAGRPYELSLPARAGDAGLQDGYDILAHLADLPFTQEFICVKLCRLFIHDNFEHGLYDYTDPARSPEADLVHQCMLAWEANHPNGQIRPILKTIFDSDLFRSHAALSQKIKTPLEYVVSAVRALRAVNPDGSVTAVTDGYALAGSVRTTASVPLARMGGMFLFDRAEPNGYPEGGGAWISAGTLAERIRFVQSYAIALSQSGHSGSQSGLGNDAGNNTYCDPVALLKRKVLPSSWTEAGPVAEFYLQTFYPAEGMANLDLYRSLAVDFLNTADDGESQSDFASLDTSSAEYETRVRGLVALLMALPQFHEQ